MMRIGTGYDVHRLVEGRPLILGGTQIPFKHGLFGHSDADVLTHAVIDALLGAAGLRDIGYYFPATDEKYKNTYSIKLLSEVAKLLDDESYDVGNIDATVIAEEPKLVDYISLMRFNIAQALGVDIEKVNIKATTTEGMGFCGRGEGIAAQAVCLLN